MYTALEIYNNILSVRVSGDSWRGGGSFFNKPNYPTTSSKTIKNRNMCILLSDECADHMMVISSICNYKFLL